jgi:cell division protein FtsZ
VEAAQAAMASPLLEAGAIDGARGILINITGSSSLKLSEVYDASSLIQSAAHEDANIIFGAVLDEEMGDEVKITVIATGFRDQMPERRARMLSMEEASVVSVPVVASDSWLDEPAQAAAAEPGPPRFKSQDEEPEEEAMEATEPVFYPASGPATAAIPVVAPAGSTATEVEQKEEVPEAPAKPRFGEMAEEPAFTPLPRDYASDFGSGVRAPAPQELEEHDAAETAEPASEAGEETDRDLDVPAFMRRLPF